MIKNKAVLHKDEDFIATIEDDILLQSNLKHC